jgi:hypothetical protein
MQLRWQEGSGSRQDPLLPGWGMVAAMLLCKALANDEHPGRCYRCRALHVLKARTTHIVGFFICALCTVPTGVQ